MIIISFLFLSCLFKNVGGYSLCVDGDIAASLKSAEKYDRTGHFQNPGRLDSALHGLPVKDSFTAICLVFV